jgi:hypothetical protein
LEPTDRVPDRAGFESDDRGEPAFFIDWNYSIAEVSTFAIYLQFFNHRKCLDLIFIYLLGLMISTGNPRLPELASIADK